MKTKPQPPAATPKARVMFTGNRPNGHVYSNQDCISPNPVLVRPYRTKQQAQRAAKWANLSYNEKVTCLAGAITFGSLSYRLSDAHSILKLLGETEGESK